MEKDGLSLLTWHAASAPASGAATQARAAAGPVTGSQISPSSPTSKIVAHYAHLTFLGANPEVAIQGLEPSQAKVNSFIGNDPAKWKQNLQTFSQVRYSNLYPGIDLVYYGRENGQLEYDLVVKPGADPATIRLRLDGDRDDRYASVERTEMGGIPRDGVW